MINDSLCISKKYLVIIIFMVSMADSATIHGIFQNQSLEENVKTALENSGKLMRVTNNSSLYEVISTIEKLQEDFVKHKQNNNHIFTDLDVLHASVIKEAIQHDRLLFSASNDTKKQPSIISLNSKINKVGELLHS